MDQRRMDLKHRSKKNGSNNCHQSNTERSSSCKIKICIKGAVSIISIDPTYKDDIARFTTVQLKSDQKCCFPDSKVIISVNFSIGSYTQEKPQM